MNTPDTASRPRARASRKNKNRRFDWRPSEQLRGRIAAFAAAHGIKQQTQVVTMFVENALDQHEWEEALPEAGTGALLERADRVVAQIETTRGRLARLEGLLGEVGMTAIAAESLLASWLAADADNREEGEDEEDAAERIVRAIEEVARSAWQGLEPSVAPALEQPARSTEPFEAAAVRHWSARVGPADGDPWSLSRAQRRMVEAWARARRCDPRVALLALLDIGRAVTAGPDGAVAPWALPQILDAMARVERQGAHLTARVEELHAAVGMLAVATVGVPHVLIHWSVQDPALRSAVVAAVGYPLSDEELERYLREQYYDRGAEVWAAIVACADDEEREDLREQQDEEWWGAEAEVHEEGDEDVDDGEGGRAWAAAASAERDEGDEDGDLRGDLARNEE